MFAKLSARLAVAISFKEFQRIAPANLHTTFIAESKQMPMKPDAILLNDRIVKTKSAPGEYPDRDCPGLRLLIQPSGAKSWLLRYTFVGKYSSMKIANVGEVSLKEARNRATAIRRASPKASTRRPAERRETTGMTAWRLRSGFIRNFTWRLNPSLRGPRPSARSRCWSRPSAESHIAI